MLFVRLMLCGILIQTVNINLYYALVGVIKLTSEVIEIDPESTNYAVRKTVQTLSRQDHARYVHYALMLYTTSETNIWNSFDLD